MRSPTGATLNAQRFSFFGLFPKPGRAGGPGLDEAEMPVTGDRRHAAARRALKVTLLDEIGFEDVLDRVALLADRGRQVIDTHRSAAELLDDREQQLAVHHVEPDRVDVEH